MSEVFATILQGDTRRLFRAYQGQPLQSVITSPPYWGLRSYGTSAQVWGAWPQECEHVWAGAACLACGAWRGELGSEPTPELFVTHLVEVFQEVRRVMHPSGVLWVNLGDSYCTGNRVGHGARIGKKQGTNRGSAEGADKHRAPQPEGLAPKNLVGIPWRFAFAMQGAGWILRAACPWVKRSAMPESVTDRPSNALEYWFMFAQSERYFWDATAIRPVGAYPEGTRAAKGSNSRRAEEGVNGRPPEYATYSGTRNWRNTDLLYESLEPPYGLILDEEGDPVALDVNTRGTGEQHFASYPEKLVLPLILASSSAAGCCLACYSPWVRVVETSGEWRAQHEREAKHNGEVYRTNPGGGVGNVPRKRTEHGWAPTCKCPEQPPIPCAVGDPFTGTGTTLSVAVKNGRMGVGTELLPRYVQIARKRCQKESGLFTGPPVVVKGEPAAVSLFDWE